MLDLLELEFFRNALIGIVIIAVASALIGTYIFARRLVAIAGGITHACFGGLGLGYFLGWNPIVLAGAMAVGSSLSVEWMARRYRVREDSAIAVIWALGMAVGVMFVFLTPGYVPELNAFLFGNILTISGSDLWAFAIYLAALAGFYVWQYKSIIATAFDRDFAFVAGVRVRMITTVMTVFVAVGIVLTIKLVGVMLLMSMLSLPQMIAETRYHTCGKLMIASAAISVACCLGGLMLTTVIDVPCSAMIVIVMVAMWGVARLVSFIVNRHN